MNNNGNCDSCSPGMRNPMERRMQRNPMMNRYAQPQMMPPSQMMPQAENGCGHSENRTDPWNGLTAGMAYVPWQQFACTYEPMQGFRAGTIFPELDKPFYGRRGMR